MLKPVVFTCTAVLPQKATEIAANLLELSNWKDFHGYGFLPGIKSATWERQSPDVIGSRIRVQNQDGSSHVEEIILWMPERQIQLQFCDFSPPVSRLANKFVETWDFEPHAAGTHVRRSFEMYAKNLPARFALWFISILLKRAIARHLQQLKQASDGANRSAGS